MERAQCNYTACSRGCPATIATDSSATVLRGVVRFRTACDAQRSGFPKRWYGATCPTLFHSEAHIAAQCSAAIGATANEHSTQAASCRSQRATGTHAADSIQREPSSGQHTPKANRRRQRAAYNIQRKRCRRRETAESVQRTPCSRQHAAHNVPHRRAADNVQRTTCGRQRVADNV